MMNAKIDQKSTLAMALLSFLLVCGTAWAEQAEKLDTINVSAEAEKELGVQKMTSEEIKKQQISNTQDLVRYNTEVDVAEVGRYGNKGFAIRGVDGNRVAMNIDGVALPEVEVNEIFAPYGYQYEGRFNPDVEMMSSVRIAAGSDSLLSGSGAVGGSVSYNTKEPVDLVKEGNLGGYLKTGYASKNDEKMTALGVAGVYDKVEFLLNYAYREGHELKNHDMKRHDKAKMSPDYAFTEEEMPSKYNTNSLIYPDALNYKKHTGLAKFYYHFNDEHRVGLHGMIQTQKNFMNVQSKNVFGSRDGSKTRFAHDKEELKSVGVNYRYIPAKSRYLESVNAGYTHSDVLGLADTWEYDLGYPRGNEIELDYREYRPVKTKTDQYTLDFTILPINLGQFAEHKFSLKTKYAKQDYTSAAHYLAYDDNKFDLQDSFVNYAFPDAKKDIYSITFGDEIYFSNRFKTSLGVRYDNYKYQPYFQGDKVGTRETSSTEEAKVYGTCISNNASSVFCDAYRAGTHNRKTKFDHITWNAMFDYQLIQDQLTARYKVGTGFLAPTVTQIYSNFILNGNEQVPNYNLKPETSLTHELEFEYKPVENATLTLAAYLTKYKDFIHTKYWNSNRTDKILGCTSHTCLQSTNLDKAEVKGLKLGVKADVSPWLNLKGKLNVTADYHFSKDKAKVQTDYDGTKEINTLASVPGMLMFGLDYYSEDDSWEIHTKLRWTLAKKASEAKYLETKLKYKEDKVYCSTSPYAGYCYWGNFFDYDPVKRDYYKIDRVANGYSEEVKIYDVVNRSKAVAIWDIYGSKKFGSKKNWILNAGVYNVTNVKYIPWETLRQFATTNTNSMVDSKGYGFNRYTAPGRNFAASLTYEF